MLLNDQEVTKEIKEKFKNTLETNDIANTTSQNIWDEAKAVLRETFTTIEAYFRKQEKNKESNLI